MIKLENIKKDLVLSGVVSGQSVKIVNVDMIGHDAVSIFYKDAKGALGERMLFRSDEANLDLVQAGRPWGALTAAVRILNLLLKPTESGLPIFLIRLWLFILQQWNRFPTRLQQFMMP
ncbi:Uncharacterized protein dnl_47560 [Desulfonema limicola]|uniref:Uncharacterized protein n=1 Tax=Desulfonema limicola TaxID=45656 RepID=A0A975GI80_9BACT|nr:hypothetical protein [Desulfonema limicola]QTA82380.1 Uncharacterized protein dnl_47560 [Desulfonema limicola]